MPTQIFVILGDYGYNLNFSLKDSVGDPIDLSGATITIDVQSTTSTTLKFTGTLSIINATAGTCAYTVQATNFNVLGQYYAEIEVAYSGKRISFDNMLINVQPDLPK